jgi:hypothetical protein
MMNAKMTAIIATVNFYPTRKAACWRFIAYIHPIGKQSYFLPQTRQGIHATAVFSNVHRLHVHFLLNFQTRPKFKNAEKVSHREDILI